MSVNISCKNCKSIITFDKKILKGEQFCNEKCQLEFKEKKTPIKANNNGSHYICLMCAGTFIPTRNTKGMYCSYKCSNGSKSVKYKIICKCCSKEFEINNIAEINRGHYQYCSNECRKRKYTINENFFDVISDTSSYWLGFICATIKSNKYNQITLVSNYDLLERFNIALGCNYPIKKSYGKKFILRIKSLLLLTKLVELGIKDPIYLEFPEIPMQYYNSFIRGYYDSDWGYHYKDNGSDVVVLHSRSSKLMRSISDYLKSKLIIDKGEWVSISFDFEKVDGQPKLLEKWMNTR